MFMFAGFKMVKDAFCIQYDWESIVRSVRKARSEAEGYSTMHPPGWQGGTATEDPISREVRAGAVIEAYRLTEFMGLECLYRRGDGKLSLGWTQVRDAYHKAHNIPRKRRRVRVEDPEDNEQPSKTDPKPTVRKMDALENTAIAQLSIENLRYEDELCERRDRANALRDLVSESPLLLDYLEPTRAHALGVGPDELEGRLLGIQDAVKAEVDPARKAALFYGFGRWHPNGKVWKQNQLAEEFGASSQMVSRHAPWAEHKLQSLGLLDPPESESRRK